MTRSRLHLFALVVLGWSTAARADTTFNVGVFSCDENTLECESIASYGLQAFVGIDTVYAPDGTTVIETLSDIVLESPLGPLIANDIASDGSTFPTFLEDNLAPFTTFTDVQFDEDNQSDFFTQDPTDCPEAPNEMLTQAGNLLTSGITINFGSGGLDTTPNINPDLTGAVSNATVTSDVTSLYGSDVFSVDVYAGSSTVCGTVLPSGYTALIAQSVVINAFVENITETENSSAPEPASAEMILTGAALLFYFFCRRAS